MSFDLTKKILQFIPSSEITKQEEYSPLFKFVLSIMVSHGNQDGTSIRPSVKLVTIEGNISKDVVTRALSFWVTHHVLMIIKAATFTTPTEYQINANALKNWEKPIIPLRGRPAKKTVLSEITVIPQITVLPKKTVIFEAENSTATQALPKHITKTINNRTIPRILKDGEELPEQYKQHGKEKGLTDEAITNLWEKFLTWHIDKAEQGKPGGKKTDRGYLQAWKNWIENEKNAPAASTSAQPVTTDELNLKARGYVQEVLSNEPDYTATQIRDDMQKWNEGFYDPLFASVRPPDTLKAIESILTQLIPGENHDNKSV